LKRTIRRRKRKPESWRVERGWSANRGKKKRSAGKWSWEQREGGKQTITCLKASRKREKQKEAEVTPPDRRRWYQHYWEDRSGKKKKKKKKKRKTEKKGKKGA